jgi:hypothetical protein
MYKKPNLAVPTQGVHCTVYLYMHNLISYRGSHCFCSCFNLFVLEKEKTENERKKEQYTKVSSAKLNSKKKVLPSSLPLEKMDQEVFLKNEVNKRIKALLSSTVRFHDDQTWFLLRVL